MQKHANLHNYTYHQKIMQLSQTEKESFKGRRLRRASSLQSDEEVKVVGQMANAQKSTTKHWRRASMPRVECKLSQMFFRLNKHFLLCNQ